MTTPTRRFERDDPVDIEFRRIAQRRWTTLLGVLLLLVAVFYWWFLAPIPVDYTSDSEHFKYGSIGSDYYDGIPLRIWQVLPAMFPEYLPDQGAGYSRIPAGERTYLDGYAQFGFLVEEDKPLPIGFSQRKVYVDRVGLNCALCHASTVKVTEADGMQPKEIYGSEPTFIVRRNPTDHRHSIRSVLILGMPANTVDLEAYFTFLFRCSEDARFTVEDVMGAIDDDAKASGQRVGPIERQILKRGVVQLRTTLLLRRRQLHYLGLLPHAADDPDVVPRFGPGRIDTFSPYKSIQFGFPFDGTYGIADYPAIWNQRPRENMDLHWDGNNKSIFERNISASIGAGVTPVTIDMHRMLRVAAWIGSPPPPHADFGGSEQPPNPATLDAYRADPVPRQGEMPIPNYPFSVNSVLVETGRKLFDQYCYKCHDWQGSQVGTVVDITTIGTDPARLDSYTEALRANQNTLGAGQWWRFKNFRKTHGYANSPLDGVWARAPYLHNGSVPTLYDLFSKPCGPKELEQLGITAETDLEALASDPARVGEIIADARSAGLRPPVFYRGDDEYDPRHGGFRCDRARTADGRRLFLFSTITSVDGKVETLLGNGHEGHYGPDFGEFTADQQAALVEYQKTIGNAR